MPPKSKNPNTVKSRRAKWVKALESGKYVQCREALAKDKGFTEDPRNPAANSFCCLGVAARVCRFADRDLAAHGFLSISGCRKLGLSKKQMARLASLNDTEGKDFPTIAKYIKKLKVKKA